MPFIKNEPSKAIKITISSNQIAPFAHFLSQKHMFLYIFYRHL
ncbi:hypothetical protein J2X07_003163 [Fictibacillus barbaricus]|uniref:Uncharacterized protein n=1 Tax=Fictibacillus barbaricus TaxID=182136 RepID=A0ABU1U3W5_9BACL|nr:hypothetical protein [Fictibacillus barbaricus]